MDRLAFSVLWEMTPDVEVVDVTYTKSVIHSRGAMTYQKAQELIDGTTDAKDEGMSDDVTSALKELMRIAKVLRKRRYVVMPAFLHHHMLYVWSFCACHVSQSSVRSRPETQ